MARNWRSVGILCLGIFLLGIGAAEAEAAGSIVAWGYNGYGECDIPAPNEDFVAVAGGWNHSLGLKSDGTIVVWGDNAYGQCDVPAPNADFVAIAAGDYHSLGLKSDGRIVAWGLNNWGQCNVPAPNADFVAVAGGQFHSLALLQTAQACCLGDGSCQDLDPVACAAAGGTSLGAGTDCESNPCPPVSCCFADGHCEDLTIPDCTAAGGTPGAYFSECATTDCPKPPFEILGITDVPNDQGRRVRVGWSRNWRDQSWAGSLIESYSIYRRIDRGGRAGPPAGIGSDTALFYPPGDWDFVKSVPAHGEETYHTLCETLCDSTVVNGMCWSVFFVRAETDIPTVYYDTPPDSGYSVDNLVPSPPRNLRMQTPTVLAWDESEEIDFDYFSVYASDQEEFDKDTAWLLGTTSGTAFDVTGVLEYYLHVTTTDFSGNEGRAASVRRAADVESSGALPVRLYLYPIEPNPTTRSALIRFDLARGGPVRLSIFDAAGREVRTIHDGALGKGRHGFPWDGRDNAGARTASGVYMCRLQAEGRQLARKILRLE